MSTTANLHFLVIFLVFLVITSFSSCSARSIVENGEKPYSKHSQLSTQRDDQKESVARVSIPAKVEHSEPYKYAATKSDHEEFASSSVQNNYKPSSLVETHERVTWKLPQKKIRGEKQPGFNLDYAPPKTHPPTHN